MPQGESLGGLDSGMDEENSQITEEDHLEDTENMDTTYYANGGNSLSDAIYYTAYTALTPVEEQTITPVESTQTTVAEPNQLNNHHYARASRITPAPVEKEAKATNSDNSQVTNQLESSNKQLTLYQKTQSF